MIIEGAISVKAAVRNGKREVEKVLIDRNKRNKDFNYIRKIVRQNGIELQEMDSEQLKECFSGRSHGGVGAVVSARRNDVFCDEDIFYLDGIEDPFNLGYAMRTLYAFGFKNVLLSERNYETMESQLLKSSAGAFDMLNVRIAENALAEIESYKTEGYHLYALYRSDQAKDVFDTSFHTRSIYLLGGEKRGVKAELLNLCDDFLYIPYASDFRNALNACAALDTLATLVYKQRK